MRRLRSACAGIVALASTATVALLAAPSQGSAELRYSLFYDARLVPTQRAVRVAVRIGDGARKVRWIRFRIDPERHHEFAGDGGIESEGDTVQWSPPAEGGTLRYVFRIDHLRNAQSYDARCAATWAIFRGDDLVPPARVRAEEGAHSQARLRMRLPQGWSVVAPYDRTASGVFVIDHPERRFDRPTGWFVAGRLGVRRERIAGSHVAVAGPVGHGLRRLDLLALMRWTLPTLREIVGELPERIVVVGAGDPMWRGGLSGPRSVFLHADRPLIEGDGTSPLLHELLHTVLRSRAGPGGDWIVEGLAELYSLEALVRSKTVSRRRHEKSLGRLAEKGRSVGHLRVDRASGAVTARAVGVLLELDERIRSASEGARSLDDVVQQLAQEREVITTERLQRVAQRVAGTGLDSFFERRELTVTTERHPPTAPALGTGSD